MKKTLLFYFIAICFFGGGSAFLISHGQALAHREPAMAAAGHAPSGHGTEMASGLLARLDNPLCLMLCQLGLIVVMARLMGRLFRMMGQPEVVGEMAAGIILGPSLFGRVFPDVSGFLFRPESLAPLGLISQIGVILFLFVVGMELKPETIRKHARAAMVISHFGILIPFFLGVALAYMLYARDPGTAFAPLALFMGIAMSITAFPVLARIIADRGLADTSLGRMALAIAAIDDVSAWTLLAFVVAFSQSASMASAYANIAIAGAFILAMRYLVKPLLARLFAGIRDPERDHKALLTGSMLVLFCSAMVTEAIGLHALFGAFLAGLSMPPDPRLKTFLRSSLEPVAVGFLLPVFFAMTGLRTRLEFLAGTEAWIVFGLVTATAVLGKFGGGMAAARVVGMGWRESAGLGALMNTRGLMELIVVNLGFELGIFSPMLYTVLVLMALATTAMTGPFLSLAGYGSLGGESRRAGSMRYRESAKPHRVHARTVL